MIHIDALTIAGIAAVIGSMAFLVRTCLREGCSRGCR